ncbi:hypothetical protein EV193_107270 [Herbihabitans rhizosphaerae]|uniref:DUF7455 domain-containing protein n=1 Tax=Herbihabitans rhizosphaerae TaxID=1872711 RepID=A0A4Q7KJ60_9PSEU|nr:hypothetical protein [Herbihabitans rhizosphaerae]RZS36589.1 hypothetical protein EV193_107270 [Herbihabitans rhizosphaerae]
MTTTAALTRLDRCDGCSAAAAHLVVLPEGELMFCGHHARKHGARLRELGAIVIPEGSAVDPTTAIEEGP